MNLAEQDPKFIQIRRTLRFVWLAMVFSMGWVTYVLFHAVKTPMPPNPFMPPIAGVAAFLSFAFPGFMARIAKPKPGATPLDTKLGMIMVTHIIRFALTEAALLILILGNQNQVPGTSIMYFGMAAALMIFHFPNDGRLSAMMADTPSV